MQINCLLLLQGTLKEANKFFDKSMFLLNIIKRILIMSLDKTNLQCYFNFKY